MGRECFESAGETGWSGKEIGCYIGSVNESWLDLVSKDAHSSSLSTINANCDFSLANHISYEYNLKGPRLVTIHACNVWWPSTGLTNAAWR